MGARGPVRASAATEDLLKESTVSTLHNRERSGPSHLQPRPLARREPKERKDKNARAVFWRLQNEAFRLSWLNNSGAVSQ